ncbi:MAG: hypothetical protein ACI9OJ_002765 [Myxococcota bacterium]|jgi:hypothetical protein
MSASEATNAPSRRGVRFWPDAGAIVEIESDMGPATNRMVVGLALNESRNGFCMIVVKSAFSPSIDQIFRAKVGDLDSYSSVVRWVRELADGVLQVGCEYLE